MKPATPDEVKAWCRPDRLGSVTLMGLDWAVAYELDGNYMIPVYVQVGGDWYPMAEVFTSDMCDEFDAVLNGETA